MNKKVKVIFSKDAQKVYDKLKENAHQCKVDKMLFDAIEKKLDIIRSNIFYGDIIPRDLIPKVYRLKYKVTSLLRVELPCFWRLLYTVRKEDRKSTRLNSSHGYISYAVFCLKKKQ